MTSTTPPFDITSLPDERGRFGEFGGSYAPVTLIPAVEELRKAYNDIREDPEFHVELEYLLKNYVGRPTPLYYAAGLTGAIGGPKIYLKREDLVHTGAHKINNAVGQGLLAKKMGKPRIIAETGAGQHGVATATVCAKMGLECVIYMGELDVERQALNVARMRLLGAEVVPVTSGSRTLKDAMNEAIRDWVTNVENSYYLIGSVAGMHPYPMMVRDFQTVIGRETRDQIREAEGRLPDAIVACVGGGSNAMGIFHPFLEHSGVALHGAEAAGDGVGTARHAATLSAGRVGVLHGSRSYVLQDADGQIMEAHSISAGLDYPGVGPEHSYLHDSGRAIYHPVTDAQALEGFKLLCQTEGIIPALEPSHAIYLAQTLSADMAGEQIMIINLSGRGDKDMHTVTEALGVMS